MARKDDPEFMQLLSKSISLDENTGTVKIHGIYGNLCINFGWKNELIVIPYSHVVWFAKYGCWPKKGNHLDHINDDPQDNRPCNLREITEAENQKKRRGRMVYRSYGTGKYGYGLNIYNDKRDGRFYVARNLSRGHGDGDLKTIKKSLGGFDTLEAAEAKVTEYIAEIEANGLDYVPIGEAKKAKRISTKLDAATEHLRELRIKGYTIQEIAKMTGFASGSIYKRICDIDMDRRIKRIKPKKPRTRLNGH
jgi:hypothetical protein